MDHESMCFPELKYLNTLISQAPYATLGCVNINPQVKSLPSRNVKSKAKITG